MNDIILYTDGGCSPNPGHGAWAAVLLIKDSIVYELSGYEPETSNNRMELTAVIKGLSKTQPEQSVILHTDSNYVKLGITTWIKSWKNNGWKTADKKPVKNQDLWIQLDDLVKERIINWQWVKGHSGDKWNDYVDELVNKTREQARVL